jgi:cyclopropane-fatty-acyl-phospholipid synthase
MCQTSAHEKRPLKVGQDRMPWLDSLLFSVFDKFAKQAIQKGFLLLKLPDGRVCEYGDRSTVTTAIPGAPAWRALPLQQCEVTIHNTDFFYKVMTRHDTGLGEAFMHRDFSVDDLGAFMAVMTANAYAIEGNRGILGALNWVGDRLLYVAHLTRANTVEGSKKNISEHYDAGNDMYKLFLDETLTYSAGIHREGGSLKDAQLEKLDALIRGAKVTAESHVLEVGCGWGSCAIRAAQTTGCHWTGVHRCCTLAACVRAPTNQRQR